MKNYEKPAVNLTQGNNEGVYMASGVRPRCRFGRTTTNAGADNCQACSVAFQAGTINNFTTIEDVVAAYPSTRREDYNGCPDNMPLE